MRVKVIILFCLVFFCPFVALSQNDEAVIDKHVRNRQIAESLFEVYQRKRNPQPKNPSIIKADTTFKQKKAVKQIVQKYVYDSATCVKDNTSNGSELLDSEEQAMITRHIDAPCQTLYNDTWCTNKVKMPSFRFGEFPDELKIRLVDRKHNRNFHFPFDNGTKSSPYGWRWNRPHTALAFAMNVGSKVYAAFDGVVRLAQVNGGYGRMILIRHYNNLETLYGHLDRIMGKVGQKVKAGDIIGYSGNTGFSTGPHLHFECRCLYQTFDPEWILDVEKRELRTKKINIEKTFFGIERAEKQLNKKNNVTNLVKVNKTFEGKPYFSFKEKYSKKNNTQFLAKGGAEPVEKYIEINCDDKSKWRYWRVREGDTITKIAQKFNITPSQIIEMNKLKSENLTPNTKIRVR